MLEAETRHTNPALLRPLGKYLGTSALTYQSHVAHPGSNVPALHVVWDVEEKRKRENKRHGRQRASDTCSEYWQTSLGSGLGFETVSA